MWEKQLLLHDSRVGAQTAPDQKSISSRKQPRRQDREGGPERKAAERQRLN